MDRGVRAADNPLVSKAPDRGEARTLVGFAETFNGQLNGLTTTRITINAINKVGTSLMKR